MKKQFISWRRVSTQKQGNSGLGLEAQKEIIRYFIEHDGGEWIEDYEECYTGTELSGCKELRKAMQHAKNIGAVLVIAKSDRFRNCQEALGILDEMGEGRIEFCDLPHSDRFTLTLFWALAEREALITSIRTKQAIAAKKARGEAVGARAQKWIESFKNKSKEDRKRDSFHRGSSKNERYIRSKETQAFLKVLKSVFPDACSAEDAYMWDWDSINTKGEAKDRILALMESYKDFDETGNLFKRFDFSKGKEKVLILMRAHLCNVRNSVLRQKTIKTTGL